MKIPGLSLGTNYLVLAIEFHLVSDSPSTFKINFRLLSDPGTPGLFDIQGFDVVDPTIDSDFIFRRSASGNMELGPAVINFEGYWESFFNQDEYSIHLFKNRFPDLVDQLF